MSSRPTAAHRATIGWSVVGLLLVLLGVAQGQTAPTTTLTFGALADSYVDAGASSTNFNAALDLRVDGSPVRITYLRFAVTGVSGRPVEQARLRLGVTGVGPSGGMVHRISNDTWNEATLTYSNRPALDGPTIATLGAVAAGTIVEFDLTGTVTGDGIYNLAIDSTNSSGVNYASNAATSGQKPALVLTVTEGAPIVSILQPPPGTSFFVGDPITLQGAAATRTGTDLSAAIAWRSSRQGALGSGAVVTTPLTAGQHVVTASVVDAQGLTGSDEVDLTVQPPPGVNTEPLVTITVPIEGKTFATGTPITFTASAADLEDGDLTSRLVWTSDRDGTLGTGGSIVRALSEGTHDVVASATDAGGLRGEHRVTVHVQTPTVLEFPAIADASVDAGSTSANTGTAATLRVDASSERIAYLRFDVTGINARQVVGATLRLQADAASSADSDRGGTLHTITNDTWLETTITYANRPVLDGLVLGTVGAVTHGQTVDFDATGAVTGNGHRNFALVSDSSDEVTYRSREGGPAPKLLVRVTGGVPAVTITAPPDGTVRFRNDSLTFTARATDPEDGDLASAIRWTSSRDGALGTGPALATSSLSVGTHTITASATDTSGLRGDARISIRVRDANAAPVVRVTAPVAGRTVPAGDMLALAATATDDFDGAIPGRITWTSDRDGALGTGPSRSVLLSEGTHVLTASATDSDGVSGSDRVQVTVTPTAPVVTIAAPASGSAVFGGTSVTFRGSARDATEGDLSASLRWTSDRDGPLGTGASVTASALTPGSHLVTASATDGGGLTGQATATIVVRPPNATPVVTVSAPATGSLLLGGAPVLLAASASDAEDGDLSAAVVWTSSRDGALGTGGTRVVAGLSLGLHVLTATVTDRDGATSSASVNVNVTAGTVAFTVVADTYVDASNATSKFGTATSLVVDGSPVKQAFLRFVLSGLGNLSVKTAVVRLTATSGSAASSNSGGTLRAVSNNAWTEATTTYNTRPTIDGAVLATQGTVAKSQVVEFNVTSALRGDGTYNFGLITSSSDDVVYQSREASSGRPQLVVTFTQNQAPAVRITAPASGTRVGQGVAIAFRGSATDAEDGDLGSVITWSSSLDGALGTGVAPVVTSLRPGVHTITAEARDAGGLTGRATITVSVTHRPVVRITAPANGTVVLTSALPLALTGEATDVEDGNLASRLTWRSDLDGPLGTGATISAATLRAGTHTIAVSASDADGLATEAYVTVRVRTPNAAPVVTITRPSDARPAPFGSPLVLAATAIDDFDGDVASRVQWTSDLDGVLGTGATVTTTALRIGTHVLRATVTDADGAPGSAERTLVVRSANATPTVAIVSPAAGSVVVTGKPVALAASASDTEDGDLRAAVRWSSSRDGALGTGGTLVVGTLSAGAHVITATVTDGDGATAAATLALTVEPSSKTFLPIADTYVDANSSTKVFGTTTGLIASTSPVREAFLRFTITGIAPLKVGRAVLRLTVGSGSSDGSPVGGTLRRISSSTWTETATTYKTRPAQDGVVLGTLATVAANQVVDFDVTAAVTANGTYDFGLSSSSSNSVKYQSREATTGKPQLIVTLTDDLPPAVQIDAPLSGAVVGVGLPLDLVATATDAESGDLTAGIRWTSSRDGGLGTGGRLRLSNLSVGTHVLSAAATDPAANTGTSTVTVVVNASPTIAITAPATASVFEPGSTATFRGTAVDTEDGTLASAIAWSSDRDGALGRGTPFTTSHLRTGAHVITASVTDRYGATASATVAIVVDARPTLAITAPSDGTTFSPGDEIALTAAATDAEDGNLGAGVRWSSDLDGPLGTGTPLPVRTLRSGTHRITATVADSGGKPASATITLRVNAAPEVTITAPATGSVFAPGDAVALTASAHDLEDGDLAAAVRWSSSLDGALGTGSPRSVTTLRSGTHVLTASVTDAGGKVATITVTLTVNAAPTLAITGPANGTTFSPGDAVTLSAAATDREDGDLTDAVTWTSSLDGALGTGSPLVVTSLRSGHHVLTATVADAGGKTATTSITIDVNGAPSLTITAPADGTTFSPGDAVSLTAAASDLEDGNLSGIVAWTSDLDGPLGSGSPLVVGALRSGIHHVTATVTDAGSKRAEAMITLGVNAAPTLAITTPATGTVFSPGDTITLAAAAHDTEDGDLASGVVWSSDLDGPLGSGSPLAITTLRSGTHRITATVVDAGGKRAETTITLRVNAAPTITVTAPANGAVFSPGDAITLTAAASDLEDGDLAPVVAWSSDLDGPLGSGTPLVIASLRSGHHVLTARVADAGGKTASSQVAIDVNAAPTLVITAPADGTTFSPGDAVALTAAAHDTEDGDLAGTVAWRSDLDGPVGTGSPLVVTTLRSGIHHLTASVTDVGGKHAEATITLRINAAPSLSITTPASGTVFSPGNAIALGADAHDAEDGNLGTAIAWTSSLDGPLGTGSPLVVATLRSGLHVVTATVTDSGGKLASADLVVVLNAAPTIAITAPSGGTFSPGDLIALIATAGDVEDGDLASAVRWSSDLDGSLGQGSPLLVDTLRSGMHLVTAAVTDAGGKHAEATVLVHVNTPPTIAITAPPAATVVAPGEVMVLAATAGDVEDGNLATAVGWHSDLDGDLGTGSPLLAALTHSGVHVLTASVTDADGEIATAETTITVNAAPTIAVTAPGEGALFSPGDAVSFTATAGDLEDGTLATAIHWSSDLDGELGTGTPLVVHTLQSGTHTITATVTDAGGKQALAHVGLVVNGAPSVTITTPGADATALPGSAVVMSGIASDVEDGPVLRDISWSSSLDGPLGTGSPLIVTTLQTGMHMITASYTDAGGRQASAEVTLLVNTPPTVTISAPTAGATFARGATITLQGTAADAEDGGLTATIAWTSSVDGPLGSGGTVSTSSLHAGTHLLRASVTDASGVQTTAQVQVIVNPSLTIAITAPADGAVFAPDENAPLAATANDSEDGDLSAAVVWTSTLDGSLGTGASFSHAPLRSGTHSIRATVTDSAGQSASAAVTIVVAPLVTLTGTSSGHYNNDHLVTKTKIDATAATFLASPSNLYPITVGGDPSIRIAGGRILGQYDRTLGWDDMHAMNNAGVAWSNPLATIDGFRIDNVEDGFRPRPGTGFTIRNAWLSYVRDDCVENDYMSGGLIDDSLFDGCYVGFSTRPSSGILAAGYDGRNNVMTIQNTLVRLQPMPGPADPSADNLGHGGFFKWHLWDRPNDSASPKLVLNNNVFMAERAAQTADRTGIPPGKLQSCSNNVMVWLGSGPFPGPALPSCFTITTDRSVWDNAVAAWKARHPGMTP